MIIPIIHYGHPTLRKVAQPIDSNYPELKQLVSDMFETMYAAANGVGLAAPQIDLSIRVVVIGFRPYDEKTDTYGDVAEEYVLINPEILEGSDEKDYFNEGCLSVPGIYEDVLRPVRVKVHYYDVDFNEHTEWFDGMLARVAQHEIDHLEGKVFTDRLSSLRKAMIKRRLNDVTMGKFSVKYKIKRRK